jgi:hypothetical protein
MTKLDSIVIGLKGINSIRCLMAYRFGMSFVLISVVLANLSSDHSA